MSRLTIAKKEHIINKAIEQSPLTKELEVAKTKLKAIGEQLRVKLLGGKEESDFIDNLVDKSNELYNTFPKELRCGQQYQLISKVYWKYLNESGHIYLAESKPGHSATVALLPEEFDLVRATKREISEIEKKISNATGMLNSLMSSVTTVKKLLEVWPAGEKFIKEVEDLAPLMLPAIQTKNLNDLLGLQNE